MLALEQLEAREVLSPVVTAPAFFPTPPQTPEGASVAFAGGPYSGGSSFAAFDVADTGGAYTADLIATRGTLDVDATLAGEYGVAVANNDTTRVTLTGGLSAINGVLSNVGYTFTPDPYYSGDATLALSIPDPAGLADGYGAYPVQVLPVVQPPAVTLALPFPGFVGPGPVPFPAGTIAVGPWADRDGSETVSAVLSLSGADATQFTLTAGGAPVALDSDFQWVVTAADQPTLQGLLDSLVLTPPAGFTGPLYLDVLILADDTAAFPSTGDSTTDEAFVAAGEAPLRYFAGGAAVAAAPLATSEGQPLDLGGLLTATDPDDAPGDVHTVTLAAGAGVFEFDPTAVTTGATVGGALTNTLTITGPLADIAAVLAAPGAVTFDPPAFYSGEVPLAVTFDHERPAPFGGGQRGRPAPFGNGPQGGPLTISYPTPAVLNAVVRVAPVASFPGAFPQFETPPLVPVGPGASAIPAGLVQLSDTPDTDGSEALAVVVDVVGGPTPGFVLTAGGVPVPRQAGGSWVLTAPTAAGLQKLLDTLTLTPAGGLTGLGHSLRFTARVTDIAAYPSDGTTATDVSSTSLTVATLQLFAPPATPTPGPASPTPTAAPVPPPSAPAPQRPTTTTTTSTTTTTTSYSPPPVNGDAGAGPAGGHDIGHDGGPAGEAGREGEGSNPGPLGDRPRPDALGAGGAVFVAHGPAGFAAAAGHRPEAGGPVSGPLFPRAEPPAALLAAAADRHPLPPVLPLDQSTPVAGFSDAGGDSFALIDAVYRDAAGSPAGTTTIPIAYTPARPARADDAGPAALATVSGPGGPTAWAGDGDPTPAGGGWPFDWLAAGLGLAAVGWLAHGRGLGRWFRRRLPGFLARPLPPTQDLA